MSDETVKIYGNIKENKDYSERELDLILKNLFETDFFEDINVDLRTGDTPQSRRTKQNKNFPFGLITTPETLHILLSSKKHKDVFKNLRSIVVDEWHELLGTKRGVQVELAISYLKFLIPKIKIIGISATLGNKKLAGDILMGLGNNYNTITSKINKKINVKSIIPKSMERPKLLFFFLKKTFIFLFFENFFLQI